MAERTVFQSNSHKRVLSLGPQASVREAAGVMTRANCGSVLIMEPPDVLLGIVTERDLMTRVLAKALDPERTTVRAVMTPHPVCVPPEMPVSDAVLIMIERGFRHLPIIGSGKKILGVFSVRDALPREIGSALSQAEFNEQVNDALG
jgi:CBS domain-containing protein